MNNKINIDKILPFVQKPSRYIDSEWNSRPPKENPEVRACLCFPDLYEVGGSNLGLEILYHMLNERPDTTCERCYCPDTDLEEILRRDNIPLFSLESQSALNSFDIVGFTLQYELCATNILNMLNLAGLPFYSKDRGNEFPLIIGGGPVTANPEPYAEFFDLFVIGDGEEALCEIIEKFKLPGFRQKNRKDQLLELAQIPGVYAPALYEIKYNSDETIAGITPNEKSVPEKINKRTVDVERSSFPAAQIVPYIETVHNRLNIEIARGCFQGCRFCQAARYYSPYRRRSVGRVMELIEQGITSTGYEEISLSSLSCTDYKDIEELLTKINEKYGADRISISLPSLRCDQFSLKIAGGLGKNKRSNLTFAPEAGTDRLRQVIGKNLTEDKIQDTLVMAWRMGWKLIKLYFMIGLPTETEEDISGINTLVKSLKARARGLNYNVTVSPFVPKPQTSFQWVKMEDEEKIKQRFVLLSKILPASVKHGSVNSSILEAVFARGDRRLSKAIVRAWEKGARFDQWREKMRFDSWKEALEEAGLKLDFYVYRVRGENEVLPWDHIVFANKQALLEEYKKALSITAVPAPKVQSAPEAVQPEPPRPEGAGKYPAKRVPVQDVKPVQKLRLKFSRTGYMKFLSHLEQIELIRRAVRRSGLPIAFTSGFHPQPKISFGPAISVGYESRCEFAEMDLISKVTLDDAVSKINRFLPPGYSLLSAKQMPVFFPSVDSLCNVAEYEIGLDVPAGKISAFLEQREILIEKTKKGKTTVIDARPLIRGLESAGGKLKLQLRFGPNKTLKPEKIISRLCGLNETEEKTLEIIRTGLMTERKDNTASFL